MNTYQFKIPIESHACVGLEHKVTIYVASSEETSPTKDQLLYVISKMLIRDPTDLHWQNFCSALTESVQACTHFPILGRWSTSRNNPFEHPDVYRTSLEVVRCRVEILD